jgi:hypothetical protein
MILRCYYYVFVLICYFALFVLLFSRNLSRFYFIYWMIFCILLAKPLLVCHIFESSHRNNNRIPLFDDTQQNNNDCIYDYCTMHYEEETECSICIQKNNEPTITLKCTCLNFYHKDCIDNWLLVNPSCPTCKVKVDKIFP